MMATITQLEAMIKYRDELYSRLFEVILGSDAADQIRLVLTKADLELERLGG